jgi:hypothetical protein
MPPHTHPLGSHSAQHPSHRHSTPAPEDRELPLVDPVRRENLNAFADKWPASPESLQAVSASLIERMDGPVTPVSQSDYDAISRPAMVTAAAEMQQDRDRDRDRRGAQWSLGDLLARASEPDPFATEEDNSYGMPPIPPMRQPEAPMRQPEAPMRQPEAPPPPAKQDSGMIFDMKDIANAVDEHVAAEVWMRYNKGERHVVSRNIYNRQGQATYDQVKRRYESDTTFRHIVDRYLADFERMLKDASKADPKGRTLQAHLTSETGRIYLVLAHASGRLA